VERLRASGARDTRGTELLSLRANGDISRKCCARRSLVVYVRDLGVGDVGLATEPLSLGNRVRTVVLNRVASSSGRVQVLLLELMGLSPVELRRSRVDPSRAIGAASNTSK
jgi:hypothetical protein